jgi:hypothetical protein
VDSCDEASDSCVNAPDDAYCDDGLWCNGAETCDPIDGCQAGTAPDCDDGVGCTDDSCDETNDVCVNVVNNSLCDDGQWCNGVEICDPALDCVAGTPVTCDDSVACTVDVCDEVNDQCVNTPDHGYCDDGDVCTDDLCNPGGQYAEPDGCEHTPRPDSDSDGVCDDIDICPGGDDNQDSDGDGIPDWCDVECDPRTQGYWHRQCLGVDGEDGISPGRSGIGPPRPIEGECTNNELLRCTSNDHESCDLADDGTLNGSGACEQAFHEECTDLVCEQSGLNCQDDSDCTKFELYTCAEGMLEGLLSYYGQANTCDALDADPPSDPCQKAMKQLTALALNVCSNRLSEDGCNVDYTDTECSIEIPDMDTDGVLDEIGDLILYLDSVIVGGDLTECRLAMQCAAEVNEGDAVANDDGGGSILQTPLEPETTAEPDSGPTDLRLTPRRSRQDRDIRGPDDRSRDR